MVTADLGYINATAACRPRLQLLELPKSRTPCAAIIIAAKADCSLSPSPSTPSPASTRQSPAATCECSSRWTATSTSPPLSQQHRRLGVGPLFPEVRQLSYLGAVLYGGYSLPPPWSGDPSHLVIRRDCRHFGHLAGASCQALYRHACSSSRVSLYSFFISKVGHTTQSGTAARRHYQLTLTPAMIPRTKTFYETYNLPQWPSAPGRHTGFFFQGFPAAS